MAIYDLMTTITIARGLVAATAATAALLPLASPASAAETLPLRDAIAALPTADEDRTGYERSKFKHWVDADRDGCNTRVICTLRSG